MGYEFPADRHYEASDHLWLRLDSADRLVVGIDRLGLEALGELAYVSFQEPGTRLKRGESFGTLEAAKMTTDIVAPVSGTLVECNESALSDPLRVNRDPYGDGWLVAIEPTHWEEESRSLVSGDAITAWVLSAVKRYRAEGWIE